MSLPDTAAATELTSACARLLKNSSPFSLIQMRFAEAESTARFPAARRGGGVRLNVPDSKTGVPATVPWVRLPPSPPSSLLLQRLPALTSPQPWKMSRFRGVLAVEPRRTGTGDCGFGAQTTPRCAFVSVAKLGGSVSRKCYVVSGRCSCNALTPECIGTPQGDAPVTTQRSPPLCRSPPACRSRSTSSQ